MLCTAFLASARRAVTHAEHLYAVACAIRATPSAVRPRIARVSRLLKLKLFSPRLLRYTRGDRSLGTPRALVYIDLSQPARPEAFQMDL